MYFKPNGRIGLSFFVLGLLALPALLLPLDSARAGPCPGAEKAGGFFKVVRKKVHRKISQAQLDSYDCVFEYWSKHKLTDRRWLAYALGTAYHESYMRPIREGSGSHRKAIAAANYAWRQGWPKVRYDRPHPKTGKYYYGRGLVQITYASNYLKVGKAIGLGDALYKNPELALKPEIATRLMFHGMLNGLYRRENRKWVARKCLGVSKKTPARLGLYFNKKCNEWKNARNMINGDTRKNGNKVARLAKAYRSGLGVVPRPTITPAPEVEEPEVTPVKPGEGGETGGVIKPIPDTKPVSDVKPEPPVKTEEGGDVKPVTDKDEHQIVPVKPGDIPTDEAQEPVPPAPVLPVAATEPEISSEPGKTGDLATAGGGALPVSSGDPGGSGDLEPGKTGEETAPSMPVVDEEKVKKLESANAEQAKKVSTIETRLGALENSLEDHDSKLTANKTGLEANQTVLKENASRLSSIEQKLDKLNQKQNPLIPPGMTMPIGKSTDSTGTGDLLKADPGKSGDLDPPEEGYSGLKKKPGDKAEKPKPKPQTPKPQTPKPQTPKPQTPKPWWQKTADQIAGFFWKN